MAIKSNCVHGLNIRKFIKIVNLSLPLLIIACFTPIVPITAQAAEPITPPDQSGFFCNFVISLGLSLSGACHKPQGQDLPPDEIGVHAFNFSPPPPAPAPKIPTMPPIVIKQEQPAQVKVVEKIVYRDPPPKLTKEKTALTSKPSAPSLNMAMLQQSYQSRLANQSDFAIVAVAKDISPSSKNIGAFHVGQQSASINNIAQQASIGIYQEDKRNASFAVDNTKILTADRIITGILETGINSQLGNSGEDDDGLSAPVIIQVSRDIFGGHGREILIPQGSRMICSYIAPSKLGTSRIGFECKRLLLAGNRAEIWDISAPIVDPQGREGIAGEVDTRFFEKYGTAFALAGISAAVRLSTAAIPTDEESDTGEILDQGSEELSSKLGEITAAILEETVNLYPIITIPQGTRVHIRPLQDLYLTPKLFTPKAEPQETEK